jgi:hypothetical protein
VTQQDPYVGSRCAEIHAFIADALLWSANDPKLGAHLAAHVTVLITGVVEDCIEFLVSKRVGRTGDHEVQNYVSQAVHQRFRNPDHVRSVGC